MSQKLIDEINNKYGLLTVIEKTKDKNNRTAWLCKCECGNEKIVRGSDLRTGKITSCGRQCSLRYTRNGNFKDETNNRYGRLTVLYRNGTNENKKVLWHCKCDCGKEIDVISSHLRDGRTLSCGCLSKEKASDRNFKNELGNKYGKLTVIELVTKHPKAIWKCKCDCGNTINVKGIYLRNGKVKSCGCLKSYPEEIITNILIENNINFQREYTFNDLLSPKGKKLRFDFAIFYKNKLYCLIEYNGKQHYEPIEYYGGIEQFQTQQQYDLLKKQYCKQNNIQLIILNDNNDLDKEIIKICSEVQINECKNN